MHVGTAGYKILGFGPRRAASGVQAAMKKQDSSANKRSAETACSVRATCSRGCDNANGFEPRIMSRVDYRMFGDGMQVAGKTVWIRNHV